MNVVENSRDRRRLDDVSIIAAASLPESSLLRSVAPNHRQLGEEGRGMDPEVPDRPAADRALDPPENPRDLLLSLSWTDEKMYMFGHDDVGPEIEALACPGLIDRLHQPPPGAIP